MNKSKGEIKKQDYKHDPHDNIHCHELGETHETCISLVPIFNHLEKEQMDEIMAVTYSVSYKKGENIYCAGDKADSLYIVSKGKIKIYRLSESGKEQLLRILHPGDFTGELALSAKLYMKNMQRQWKKPMYAQSRTLNCKRFS
jgi:CRP/FNR family transcriptional regulator